MKRLILATLIASASLSVNAETFVRAEFKATGDSFTHFSVGQKIDDVSFSIGYMTGESNLEKEFTRVKKTETYDEYYHDSKDAENKIYTFGITYDLFDLSGVQTFIKGEYGFGTGDVTLSRSQTITTIDAQGKESTTVNDTSESVGDVDVKYYSVQLGGTTGWEGIDIYGSIGYDVFDYGVVENSDFSASLGVQYSF